MIKIGSGQLKKKPSRDNLLNFAISHLNKSERKTLTLFASSLILLSFLDVIGVIFLGALGALLISGISVRGAGNRLQVFLEILKIDTFDSNSQLLIVAITAILILLLRTILTVYLTRKTLQFLSAVAAKLSSLLFAKVLSRGFAFMKNMPFQRVQYAINKGVDVIFVQSLGTTLTIISDCTSLVLIFLALFFVDPIVSISSTAMFVIVGLLLYRLLSNRAKHISYMKTEFEINSNTRVGEAFSIYREIFVRNGEELYSSRFESLRVKSARLVAEATFLPNITKFFIEASLVFGASLIGILQFLIHDSYRATATLSLFLAASIRIAPAVIRIQQSFLIIRSNAGQSEPTIMLLQAILRLEETYIQEAKSDLVNEFATKEAVRFDSVQFDFDDGHRLFEDISFNIDKGEFVSIIGKSGSGKSTLVDLMVGLERQNSGNISVFGLPPKEFIRDFPFGVSYVPQVVALIEGTIRDNILIGLDNSSISDEQILAAIKCAQLEEFVELLPYGLDTQLGPKGRTLSGGQRQRIGLARALLKDPQLLVLDEATSSLDATTEKKFMETILGLKGKITIVMVAHRLDVVEQVDKAIVLHGGKIVAIGKFAEVRKQVPNIDDDAIILNL